MITVAMLQDSSDARLRRVFAWQTRYGMAPKFGSRPIGRYQTHQCQVSSYLVDRAKICSLSSMARIKVHPGNFGVVVGIEVGEIRERYLCSLTEAYAAGDKVRS